MPSSFFSNLFNAQSILDKQSLSNPESLGKQIAFSSFVYATMRHKDNVTSTFDGEGTQHAELSWLIMAFWQAFHSCGTAKRLNAQPTGHANMGAKWWLVHTLPCLPGAPAQQECSLADAKDVILSISQASTQSRHTGFLFPAVRWLGSRRWKIDEHWVSNRCGRLSRTTTVDYFCWKKKQSWLQQECVQKSGLMGCHCWDWGIYLKMSDRLPSKKRTPQRTTGLVICIEYEADIWTGEKKSVISRSAAGWIVLS